MRGFFPPTQRMLRFRTSHRLWPKRLSSCTVRMPVGVASTFLLKSLQPSDLCRQRLPACGRHQTQSATVTLNSPVPRIFAPHLELIDQGFAQRTSAQAYSSVLHNPRALFNLSRDTDPVFGPCQTRLPDAKEIPAGLKLAHVNVHFDENKLMF